MQGCVLAWAHKVSKYSPANKCALFVSGIVKTGKSHTTCYTCYTVHMIYSIHAIQYTCYIHAICKMLYALCDSDWPMRDWVSES